VDLLNRIQDVLSTEINEAQLDKFLADVRDSLSTSSRQFLYYQIATVVSIVVYHLIVYGGSTSISFNGVQLTDTALFRRTFLIFPASLLAATASVGYLRRLQRESYDFLAISRYRILGKTGLHELRLPGDYILGLFLLKEEGGLLGKIVSCTIMYLIVAAFGIAPTGYVTYEAIKNIQTFGFNDWLCVVASMAAIVLSVCGLLVIPLSGRIQVTPRMPILPGPSSPSAKMPSES
jgi:hypothetical protein